MNASDENRVDVLVPEEMFWRVLSAMTKKSVADLKTEALHRTIVAIDPGETTGIAVWNTSSYGKMQIKLFQVETKDVGSGFDTLLGGIKTIAPDHIRCEEYRVYNWMADSHSWSVLHTPQLIGAVKVLAHMLNIPLSFKLAQQPKAVFNDSNLKMMGVYSPGLKHARDAERHLLYHMAFPEKTD